MTAAGLTDVEILGLAEAIDHVPTAIGIVDAAGRILYVNERASELTERLGKSMPEDVGGGFDICHPDGRPYGRDEWPVVRSITSGEQVVDEEYFHVLPDGGRLFVRCNSSPVYDSGGRIVAGVLVMVDITADREAAERLSYFDRLLENTEDAIVGTDPDFRLAVWNAGAERLYGYRADEALGRHAREMATYEGDRSRYELESSLLETGRARTELTARRRDGTFVDVEIVVVAVRDDRNDLVGYLGVHRDVSDRKSAERDRETRARQQEVVRTLEVKALAEVDAQAVMDDAVAALCRTLEVEMAGVAEIVPGGEEVVRGPAGRSSPTTSRLTTASRSHRCWPSTGRSAPSPR
jgi:PAS domain S-box-containing protein